MTDRCAYTSDGIYDVDHLKAECRDLRVDCDQLRRDLDQTRDELADLTRWFNTLRARVDHQEMALP